MTYFSLMIWSEFISQLLDIELRLSSYDVQRLCGIQPAIVDRWKKGEVGKPQRSTIKRLEEGLKIKINDSDPNNITYSKVEEPSTPSTFNYLSTTSRIPLLKTMVHGGASLQYYIDHGQVDNYIDHFTIKDATGKYALEITGDSMADILKPGDYVIIDTFAQIHNNSVVVVRLKTGEQYCKRYKLLDNGFIQLKSENYNYEPIIIHESTVDTIHRVISIMHNNL